LVSLEDQEPQVHQGSRVEKVFLASPELTGYLEALEPLDSRETEGHLDCQELPLYRCQLEGLRLVSQVPVEPLDFQDFLAQEVTKVSQERPAVRVYPVYLVLQSKLKVSLDSLAFLVALELLVFLGVKVLLASMVFREQVVHGVTTAFLVHLALTENLEYLAAKVREASPMATLGPLEPRVPLESLDIQVGQVGRV